MARRLDRFLALPLVLTLGLTLKTAVASIAIAAGGVSVGAVVVHELRVLQSMSRPLIDNRPGRPVRTERNSSASVKPLPSASALARVAVADIEEQPANRLVAEQPQPDAARNHGATATTGTPKSVPPVVSGDNLSREAAMLEAARRALGASPGEALAIADEHRAAFSGARLELERELIRVDALYRLGRFAEARRAAEALRQRGGLYAERVQRLIEKLDASER
jgi:hypothetical protein